jgi:hypothetical protein
MKFSDPFLYLTDISTDSHHNKFTRYNVEHSHGPHDVLINTH